MRDWAEEKAELIVSQIESWGRRGSVHHIADALRKAASGEDRHDIAQRLGNLADDLAGLCMQGRFNDAIDEIAAHGHDENRTIQAMYLTAQLIYKSGQLGDPSGSLLRVSLANRLRSIKSDGS